jgi:hypothetical protein
MDNEEFDLAFHLADMGREGWEAVNFQCEREPIYSSWSGDVEILFKRPIKDLHTEKPLMK